MTVVCNGQTFTGGTVDTSVADGTAICTITGLAAATRYSAQVYVGGTSIGTVSIITNPSENGTFTVGYGNCTINIGDPLAYQAVVNRFPDLSAFIWGGDSIYSTAPLVAAYTENEESIWDVEDTTHNNPLDQATTMAAFYTHYRLWWKKASYKYVMQRIPSYFITDDHEWPGNNWVNTISPITLTQALAAANTYSAQTYHSVWATTQAHLDNMRDWGIDAFQHYTSGNPASADAVNGLYYDFTIGDAHFICIECTTYNNDLNSDGASGTNRYGVTQLAWIENILATTTKTWKILCIGKGSTDYFNQRAYYDPLEQYVADNPQITGILMMSGDVHSAGTFQHAYPVCCGGAGTAGTNTIPDGYQTSLGYTRWKRLGNYSATISALQKPDPVVSFVRVHGKNKLEFGHMDGAGAILQVAELLPTTNALSYPT